MKWKENRKRNRAITKRFAIFPTFLRDTKEYIWLEWCYCYAVDTGYGTASFYASSHRYLYEGFIKSGTPK